MFDKLLVLLIPGNIISGKSSVGISADGVQLVYDWITKIIKQNFQILVCLGFDNFQRAIPHEVLGTPNYLRDYTAALATQINGLIILDNLTRQGIRSKLLTPSICQIPELTELYSAGLARDSLIDTRVIISTAGVEQELYLDDFSAALRAAEISADVFCKLVPFELYPSLDELIDGERTKLTYQEALVEAEAQHIPIKAHAISLCADNGIPIIILNAYSKNGVPDILAYDSISPYPVWIVRE